MFSPPLSPAHAHANRVALAHYRAWAAYRCPVVVA